MPAVTLNYAAIFVCGLVYMGIGMIWYGGLFSKPWAKAVGLDTSNKHKMEEMKKKSMPAMVGSFFCSLVMAYVLSHFIDYAMAKTALDGAITGFWVWLGFNATLILVNVLYQMKEIKLWFIDAGFMLFVMLAFGGILAAWA
jgi:hypothetical protein